eukprot:360207-Chlamydomonas_euryale.AAC.13
MPRRAGPIELQRQRHARAFQLLEARAFRAAGRSHGEFTPQLKCMMPFVPAMQLCMPMHSKLARRRRHSTHHALRRPPDLLAGVHVRVEAERIAADNVCHGGGHDGKGGGASASSRGDLRDGLTGARCSTWPAGSTRRRTLLRLDFSLRAPVSGAAGARRGRLAQPDGQHSCRRACSVGTARGFEWSSSFGSVGTAAELTADDGSPRPGTAVATARAA